MYKRILVTPDQSELAEQALPHYELERARSDYVPAPGA